MTTRRAEELSLVHRDGEKPPDQWRTGGEHELLCINQNGQPPPYEGPAGIAAVLAGLADDIGLERIEESGVLVSLKGRGGSVTLEPGGQVELSGAPHSTLHGLASETQCFQDALDRVASDLNLSFFAMGLRPITAVSAVPRMPKARYALMEQVMPTMGSRSLEMMFATGTIQCNLDYGDEEDMAEKFRCAALLSPVVTGLLANSPYQNGKPTGWMSTRQAIWDETAINRSGRFDWMVSRPLRYESYAAFAAGEPLLFRQASESLKAAGPEPFLDGFLRGDLDLEDWVLHLTTVFPEVRLKHMLELRGADGGTGDLVIAVNALWTGILYDHEARRWVLERLGHLGPRNWDRLAREASRTGLAAQAAGLPPLFELADEMLQCAAAALQRREKLNGMGEDESIWLRPLQQFVAWKASPAELLLRRFGDDVVSARAFLSGHIKHSPWLA